MDYSKANKKWKQFMDFMFNFKLKHMVRHMTRAELLDIYRTWAYCFWDKQNHGPKLQAIGGITVEVIIGEFMRRYPNDPILKNYKWDRYLLLDDVGR